jgi:hypothetical protein
VPLGRRRGLAGFRRSLGLGRAGGHRRPSGRRRCAINVEELVNSKDSLLSRIFGFRIGFEGSRQILLVLRNLIRDAFKGLRCCDGFWSVGVWGDVCLLDGEAAAERTGCCAVETADRAYISG